MVTIPVVLCHPQALSLLNQIIEHITSRVVDQGVRYREDVLRSEPVRVPRLRGNRLIDLFLPVHLLIPGPLLTASLHRVSSYIIICTINLANV
jgi:hypothetical protein